MTSLGATRFPFRSSSILAIVEAVRQGVGIAAQVEQVGQNVSVRWTPLVGRRRRYATGRG